MRTVGEERDSGGKKWRLDKEELKGFLGTEGKLRKPGNWKICANEREKKIGLVYRGS
jgi:hypothetical protein